MPELPEVEVCRLNVVRWLQNNPIKDLELKDPRLLVKGDPIHLRQHLIARMDHGWTRHGKLLFGSHPAGFSLAIHLRMTGRMSHVLPGQSPPPYTRAILHLESGACIAFVDMRRLGQWWWGETREVHGWTRLQERGPDALLEPLDGPALLSRVKGRKRSLKDTLLDQSVLAGIGNIAACEIAYRAGLSPHANIQSLSPAQAATLSVAIQTYLIDSIARDDGQEIIYQGEKGATNPFAIYGRENEPCPKCAEKIRRRKTSGRSSYWCPTCQIEPAA